MSFSIVALPPVLADATYVFHLAGQDGNGYYYVAGAFTVQNGVITAGEQDMIDGAGFASDSISAAGSTLSTENGNIQVVLNTADNNVGVDGYETLRGTMVSSARVLITEFDTFATANGSIDLQTSAAAPVGGYAFSVGGEDGTSSQNTFAIGGVLNVNGSSVEVGSSVFDYNDAGNVNQNQGFTSGTVAVPDAFGRVVFTLTPSATSGLPGPFALAGYTVSSNEIQLVETQDDLGATLGGLALGQGSNTGQFSQASVAGSTYLFGANGEDAFSENSTVFQMAGYIVPNAGGSLSGLIAFNDLTIQPGAQISSGTYSVDPTGRMTVNVVTTIQSTSVPFTFQFYLDGNGNALELGVDENQVTWGSGYLQTASSADFEGSYALNAYGFSNFNQIPAWSGTGPVTVASDTVVGTTDISVQNTDNSASALAPGVGVSGSETNSSGQLSLYGLNATLDPQMQSSFGYFPIDGRRVLAIELDNAQMGLMMLEQVQQQ